MSADVRSLVCAEARTWLGTPFHHAAMIKGVGVDCIHLVVGVYVAAGVIALPVIPAYPPDWWMHHDEERILEGIAQCSGVEVEAPLPGDLAVYRFGRCFSHVGIVLEWPLIIHAHFRSTKVALADGDQLDLRTSPGSGNARARRFYGVIPR